jgi:hypothetical protein
MSHDAQMPGAWVCDQCGFTLQKNVLHVKDGFISADTSTINEPCPNDGMAMRPLTWREANEGIMQELIKERTRLDWLDQHCAFVADYEYSLGPFKRGELRKLADAGLGVDSVVESMRKTREHNLDMLRRPIDDDCVSDD